MLALNNGRINPGSFTVAAVALLPRRGRHRRAASIVGPAIGAVTYGVFEDVLQPALPERLKPATPVDARRLAHPADAGCAPGVALVGRGVRAGGEASCHQGRGHVGAVSPVPDRGPPSIAPTRRNQDHIDATTRERGGGARRRGGSPRACGGRDDESGSSDDRQRPRLERRGRRRPSSIPTGLHDYQGTKGITGDTIKIGTIRPASGPYAIYDKVTSGLQAYFDSANAAGRDQGG